MFKNIKTTRACEVCGFHFSAASFILRVLPFFVRCRKCGSTMVAKGIFWQVLVTYMGFGLAGVLYLQNHYSKLTAGQTYDYNFMWFVAAVFAAEFCCGLLVCNKATLKVSNNALEKKQKKDL